jgi:hypothetical protein
MALSWRAWTLGIVLQLTCSVIAQSTSNFTIVGGQIYTPGLAIVDAPQPFTPLGGGKLAEQSTNNVSQLISNVQTFSKSPSIYPGMAGYHRDPTHPMLTRGF